jgi:hypothetical protein
LEQHDVGAAQLIVQSTLNAVRRLMPILCRTSVKTGDVLRVAVDE